MKIKNKVIGLFNIYSNQYAKAGNFGGNVFDKNGLCPTLNGMTGGGRQPMIIVDAEEDKYE